MKRLICCIVLLGMLGVNTYAVTVNDTYIGYSFDLPENWVREVKSSTHHVFYDSSATFRGCINVVMSDFANQTVYASADDWTRAHFLAYYITIKSSLSQIGVALTDPFGAVVYYDTTTVVQNGQKAMELYANFYSLSTTSECWAEFVRYSAVGKKGYELYTIGDTADMKKNIGLYIALTDLIQLDTTSKIVMTRSPLLSVYKNSFSGNMRDLPLQDLMGRNCAIGIQSTTHASGLIINHNRKTVVIKK